MSDFDREIERELNRILGPVDSATIPAWRNPTSGGFMKKVLGGTGAAIAAKLATAFAVVAMAAAGAGVATTGSLNPNVWGQQVKIQVATCKTTLRASGVRGIGPCVSAFARQHGEQVSDQHQASNARDNGNHGKGHGNGNGNGNGNSGNHPTGKPSDVPHGKPSTVPPVSQ